MKISLKKELYETLLANEIVKTKEIEKNQQESKEELNKNDKQKCSSFVIK